MISRILIGIAIVGLGVLMVVKTPWFLSMVGRVYFAEKYLGGGGTRLFLKLLGVAIAVIGLIVITDLWDNFLAWMLAPLTGGR
ncbi:MAG: hypothetical protein Q8P30_00400 [Candidatus Uhrbacteria bacterium]|nr:hypothetical protein [Candidatus Uhrbacteria bacterium]